MMLYCGKIRDFYPRPPRGGRLDRLHKALNNMTFLSTPSARRTTRYFTPQASDDRYFYPRPPRGGRRTTRLYKVDEYRFLSTPSARRATRRKRRCPAYPRYFYPRPPQGGRRLLSGAAVVNDRISIHALREEGDKQAPETTTGGIAFLSTPSARRATNKHPKPQQEALHFYPRPPRGGRLSSVIPSACPGTFLSTPSARRATRFTIQTSFLVANISIHALREEGDSIGRLPHRHNRNFYPRPPRGGRLPF